MTGSEWLRGTEEDLYRVLAELTAAGEPAVLVTVIASRQSTPRHLGAKMIVHGDGAVTGSIGGGQAEALIVVEARQVLNDGGCRRLSYDLRGDLSACGGELEVFLEPVGSNQPFWLIGAGHVGRALLRLGRGLPFKFTVVDDRPEFLADLQGAATVTAAPAELAAALGAGAAITPSTLLLIASRSHKLDEAYLEAVFAAEAEAGCELPYLGVIGSRNKAAKLAARFGQRSELSERWQRVQIPVGLAIGAESPAEIALSILAEALAVSRRVPLVRTDEDGIAGVYLHRRSPRSAGAQDEVEDEVEDA